MRIRGVSCLFGKETEGMKPDVLQAILNLTRTNDPNWLKIRDWISKEHEAMIPQAAYSIGLAPDTANAFKGMAVVLGALSFFFQEPQVAIQQMNLMAQKQKQQANPIPPGPGIS